MHNEDHLLVQPRIECNDRTSALVNALVEEIKRNPRLLGILDPGTCMGMINALFDPGLAAGVFMPVQYLSQAELWCRMRAVSTDSAKAHLDWLKEAGTKLHLGRDPKTSLTQAQLLQQMRMYDAGTRLVADYQLAGFGVPYQRGLGALGLDAFYEEPVDEVCAASDLPEGMWNNADRPPVYGLGRDPILDGFAIPHANEGDLGSLMAQVLMFMLFTRLGMPQETTLHDVRWGEDYNGAFTWLLEISGGAPPAHFGGWQNTHVFRQPAMYFPAGGGTCSGVTLPGQITWARAWQDDGNRLWMDIGLGDVVELPEDEVRRRLKLSTEVWPCANVVIKGVGRDQLMATHPSNHITIGRGNIAPGLALLAQGLGFNIRLVGEEMRQFASES